MRYSYLLVAILAAFMMLAIQSCSEETTGTEVANEHTLSLYDTDGVTPVKNATVRVYRSDDTSHIPVFTTETDDEGSCVLKSKFGDDAYYNIYAEADSLVSFQDSVLFGEDVAKLPNDTMNVAKSVSGVVTLDVNHNVQTVTVHVLGTFIKTGVEKDGSFTLNKLAHGDYTVMCISTIDEYTPLYYNLTVTEETTTIPDTLKPIYTGIPAVTGLTATIDTALGTVTLNWDACDYFDLQDYRIFRTYGNSDQWPEKALYSTVHTTIIDTIYRDSNQLSSNSALHFKYRIQITNNANTLGNPYKYVEAKSISPSEAFKVFQSDTISVKRDGTVTIAVTPSPWFGTEATVKWDIGATGIFATSSSMDTSLTFPADSIIQNYPVAVEVIGVHNRTVVDTVFLCTKELITPVDVSLPTNEHIIFTTVKEFGETYYGFYYTPANPNNRGIYVSKDGLNWTDFDTTDPINKVCGEPIVHDNKLCFITTSEDLTIDNSLTLVTIDESGAVSRESIGEVAEKDYNYFNNWTYLLSEGDQLYIVMNSGIRKITEGKIATEVDASYPSAFAYSDFVQPFIYNGESYVLAGGNVVTTNGVDVAIYKHNGQLGYEKVLTFAELDESISMYYGSHSVCTYGDGILIVRKDTGFEGSKQLIYSEDLTGWTSIGEIPDGFSYTPFEVDGKITLIQDNVFFSLE